MYAYIMAKYVIANGNIATKQKEKDKIMDNVIKFITNFFAGLLTIFTAIIPVSILWYVLTGGTVFGINVVTNLSNLINQIGQGGFAGLVVLVLLVSFFTKK